MVKPVIVCPTCGATITPEEITAGKSLVCPQCEEAQKASKENPVPAHDKERSFSPSLEHSASGPRGCGCGHGVGHS